MPTLAVGAFLFVQEFCSAESLGYQIFWAALRVTSSARGARLRCRSQPSRFNNPMLRILMFWHFTIYYLQNNVIAGVFCGAGAKFVDDFDSLGDNTLS